MNSLEIAKKMERDSIKFYTEAAAKTKYPDECRLRVAQSRSGRGRYL